MRLLTQIKEKLGIVLILIIMGAGSAVAIVAHIFISGLHKGEAVYPASEAASQYEIIQTEDGLIYVQDNRNIISGTDGNAGSYRKLVININKASPEELMLLPGVGEMRANAIIEYREVNGEFMSVDELLEIAGIGEKVYYDICDYCTVEGSAVQYIAEVDSE